MRVLVEICLMADATYVLQEEGTEGPAVRATSVHSGAVGVVRVVVSRVSSICRTTRGHASGSLRSAIAPMGLMNYKGKVEGSVIRATSASTRRAVGVRCDVVILWYASVER